LQDLENEEEVKLRADEFKQHPLFAHLSLYTEELKDYIEEKRKKQAEI
jgi:predicted SpoU family rRNA methylase